MLIDQKITDVKNYLLGINSILTKNFNIQFLEKIFNLDQKYESIIEKYLCNIMNRKLDWRELALNEIKTLTEDY